ncbi:MAG: hypothetical protein O7D30_12915, partial [Rickettsia endosymbiont of Ixodes persulcatus]|nr:hypothetical protein [Rickettsia endosymbiont of Ixodes persulcatus]
ASVISLTPLKIVRHRQEDVEPTTRTRKRAGGLTPTPTTSHFNGLFMGDRERLAHTPIAHARRRWRHRDEFVYTTLDMSCGGKQFRKYFGIHTTQKSRCQQSPLPNASAKVQHQTSLWM